jgi:peptide methionine sulfoxide reductase MsrA
MHRQKNVFRTMKKRRFAQVVSGVLSMYLAVGVDEAYLIFWGRCKELSYELVGSNTTGHAEAVAVFDPKVVSFKELVMCFFARRIPQHQSAGVLIVALLRSIAL